MTVTRHRMQHVFDFVSENASAISEAHDLLGVPLDEAICAAVRKALADYRLPPGQLELALRPAAQRRKP